MHFAFYIINSSAAFLMDRAAVFLADILQPARTPNPKAKITAIHSMKIFLRIKCCQEIYSRYKTFQEKKCQCVKNLFFFKLRCPDWRAAKRVSMDHMDHIDTVMLKSPFCPSGPSRSIITFARGFMKHALRRMKRNLFNVSCFFALNPGKKNGGVDRSRTGLSDFADRCLTDWLPRLV